MNYCEYRNCNTEYLRVNELPAGGLEAPPAVESSIPSQLTTVVEAKVGDGEGPNLERERKIELWMEEIKKFIRRIDVNNL